MVDKIAIIQEQESLVSKRLQEIIEGNIKTTVSLQDIFTVISAQLDKSSLISDTVKDLVATVKTIANQTAEQKVNGEELHNSLLLLENVTDAIVISAREQRKCNDELNSNLMQIQSVSEDNLDVIEDLKELTK